MTLTFTFDQSIRKIQERGAAILRRLPFGSCEMVEVGVNVAALSAYLLEGHADLRWNGVDSWLGAEMQPEAYRATGDKLANQPKKEADARRMTAIERLKPFGERALVYHMSSNAAALLFEDESLDLAFIDADHSYEGVMLDAESWWPKVRKGGWLGFHDYGNRSPRVTFGVDTAVREFSEQIGRDFETDEGCTAWIRKPDGRDWSAPPLGVFARAKMRRPVDQEGARSSKRPGGASRPPAPYS